ncbi:MAG: 50S ribosomal protein L24 [Eubacteriales bacterium]|nr:50S ribosomal protein L24 [Eubacteriales bacterium]
MKVHVKKDDNVYVLSGKDAGKTGKVLKVFPVTGRVIVEGVSMSVKHEKPRGRYQQGGIIHQESPVSSSNVMVVCSKCKRPSKLGHKLMANGEKIRVCKACGAEIDTVAVAKK